MASTDVKITLIDGGDSIPSRGFQSGPQSPPLTTNAQSDAGSGPSDSGGHSGAGIFDSLSGLGSRAANFLGISTLISSIKELIGTIKAVREHYQDGEPLFSGSDFTGPSTVDVTAVHTNPVGGSESAGGGLILSEASSEAAAGLMEASTAALGFEEAMVALAPETGGLTLIIAALAAGVALAVEAFSKVTDELNQQVDQLEGYSAQLSQSSAIRDLRLEMANMRRADRVGPDLAVYEDLRGRVEQRLVDLGTEIYAAVAKMVTNLEPAITVGLNSLDVVIAQIGVLLITAETAKDVFTGQIGDLVQDGKDLVTANKKLTKAMMDFTDLEKDKRMDTQDDKFLTDFMTSIGDKLVPPNPGRRPLGA